MNNILDDIRNYKQASGVILIASGGGQSLLEDLSHARKRNARPDETSRDVRDIFRVSGRKNRRR